MSARTEERRDRDIIHVEDTRHDETVRNLKEYLKRPILAKEADDPVRLNGDALRRHADLANAPEHPYTRLVREHREAKK